MSENKIQLVSIVGPTASGKTALSINLAKKFDGEIVSADSMQIYKGMDIATAKPSVKEQAGIKHHLIDFLEPQESFSVAQYCELAHAIIKDISDRGKLPILVGGTGLYVDSLINNITFSQCSNDEGLREELYSLYLENGVEYLIDMLSKFDSPMAEKLSVEKNVKRIIRAIEIYKVTGVTMTQHNLNSRNVESPYDVVKIGITATDRQFLYDRINRRVDLMIENGLVEEAKAALKLVFSNTSSMAIGHKELLPYFEGNATLEQCVENLKMQTRRYAKRQLTWFNKDKNINWFNIDEIDCKELVLKASLLIKKELFNE
ncbi:MAG: tRNA (adenosine(37)-N6)-dimethylallyltransferase MiaA [Ruminococcus sp.]|nr:tRNA (adenosine(37)-N6)-dimethylallyltransferase MiaA [Ruminococcus sp.]